MSKKYKGNKTYVVFVGRNPGIYTTWEDCKAQVDGFPNNFYRGYSTKVEAEAAYKAAMIEEKNNNGNNVDANEDMSWLEGLVLKAEQKKALEDMKQGGNIFLTGKAGTGKSLLIKKFIYESEKESKRVLVCAPTGIAAINIGGVTIHRAFKIHPSKALPETAHANNAIIDSDIIVIDEISMCRLDIFEYVIKCIRVAEEQRKAEIDGANQIQEFDETNMHMKKWLGRNSNIQLITVGDFYQLPPVIKAEEKFALEMKYGDILKDGFAFESHLWNDISFKPICLEKVIRQDNEVFANNLNLARIGDLSCIDYFNHNSDPNEIDNAICIVGTNRDVEKENDFQIARLKSECISFQCQKNGSVNTGDMPTEEILRLKPECRIMMVANDSENRYQNGSLGNFIGFSNDMVEVKLDGTRKSILTRKHKWSIKGLVENPENHQLEIGEVGSFTQYPIKVAYAITIHKSQGQTYDAANILPNTWSEGQLYVALSRVKSISSIHLIKKINENGSELKASDNVKSFYKTL